MLVSALVFMSAVFLELSSLRLCIYDAALRAVSATKQGGWCNIFRFSTCHEAFVGHQHPRFPDSTQCILQQ